MIIRKNDDYLLHHSQTMHMHIHFLLDAENSHHRHIMCFVHGNAFINSTGNRYDEKNPRNYSMEVINGTASETLRRGITIHHSLINISLISRLL